MSESLDFALTLADMDEIGAELGVLRPDLCAIRRRTEGVDAGGGEEEGFGPATEVRCRVGPPPAPGFGVAGGQAVPEADVVIAVARGTDIGRGDQITVRGQSYVVLDDPERASFQFELSCFCKDSDGLEVL